MKAKGIPPNKLPTVSSSAAPRKKQDQQGGSSCHQCKSRRNCTDLTYCTSNLDKKKKKCRKKYCEHCLRKFYRESPAQINERPTWKCPSCRKICCCAACRRREMRDKENGNASSSASQATGAVPNSNPSATASTTTTIDKNNPQSRPTPQMGIDCSSNAEDSGTSLNPFTAQPSSQSSFKALYAIAQMPSVKKHIKYILSRKDITDAQRVESIATLLRGSSSKSSRLSSTSLRAVSKKE
mmetsp:Transcript_17571/g.42885  ORF Transcript_17571/g.42885 Transcript_17571/m.42885 type:complete len:239 (-) Transcript_17571:592-1308(-)